MRKTTWKNLTYYHYEAFLSQQAMVRDSAGTLTTGPTLFVTFNSFEAPELEMDSSSAESGADTTLYREANIVRGQVLAEGPAGAAPGEMRVVNPSEKPVAPRPKPRPIVRYRSENEAVIDEKTGTITITGNVYLSQGLVESGQFLELRADAAVLFLSRQPESKPAEEKDVLAPEKPSRPPGSEERLAAGFGARGGPGQETAVAGVYLKGDVVLTRGDRMIRATELYYDSRTTGR